MDGAVLGVGQHALSQEALILHFLADKATGQGQLLSPAHNLQHNQGQGQELMSCWCAEYQATSARPQHV